MSNVTNSVALEGACLTGLTSRKPWWYTQSLLGRSYPGIETVAQEHTLESRPLSCSYWHAMQYQLGCLLLNTWQHVLLCSRLLLEDVAPVMCLHGVCLCSDPSSMQKIVGYVQTLMPQVSGI